MKGKLLFEEYQSFKFTFMWWMAVVLTISIGAPLTGMFIYGAWTQIVLDIPWGDKPAPDLLLVFLPFIIPAIFTIPFLILHSFSLTTQVDRGSIRYKFPPMVSSFKSIEKYDVKSMVVKRYKPILEYGGWGYRMNFSGKKQACNISGNMGLEIIFQNGNKLLIGTQKPVELNNAIGKLQTNWLEDNG